MIKRNTLTSKQADTLVLLYRQAEPPQQNKIFKQLRNIYLYILHEHIKKMGNKYKHYLESEYDFQLLKAISKWDGVNEKTGKYCSFKSYLYTKIKKKVKSEVLEKYALWHKREVAIDKLPGDIREYLT